MTFGQCVAHALLIESVMPMRLMCAWTMSGNALQLHIKHAHMLAGVKAAKAAACMWKMSCRTHT